jgi:hypothetical protein
MSLEIKSDNPDQALLDALPQTEYGRQESWTNGKVRFEMFPEGYIALNKELATGLHPKLEKLLANHPADETDVKLAEIASYCQVALDATYTLAERDKLCFILAGRLEALRELPAPTVVIQ